LLEQIGTELDAVNAVNRQSQTSESKPAGPFDRVPLAIRFDGTFDAFCHMLHAAEHFDRLVHVDRLTITRERLEGDHPLQVVMNLSVFAGVDQGTGE
jgi:hypothetical protein